MGKDSVLACLRTGADDKRIQMLYTADHGKAPKNIGTPDILKYNIRNAKTWVVDGSVTCKFGRRINTNFTEIYDIDEKKYYALFARGKIDNNEIKQHDKDKRYIIKNRKIDFMKVVPITDGKVKTSGYIKAHGCLMAIAWMFFAPVGIFTARYLKTFFKEEKNPDEAWSFIHWACMATTVVLTVIAFALIYIENGGYKSLDSYPHAAHPPLGVFIFVVCLVNPVGGLFLSNMDKDDSRRVFILWIHRLFGILAAILSLVQVMIGLDLPKANSGSSTVKWWVLVMLIVNTIYGIILDLVKCGEDNDKDNKDGDHGMDSVVTKPDRADKPERKDGEPDESTREGRDEKRYRTRQGIYGAIIVSGIGLTIRVLVAVGTD
ncbi:DgyrCDS2747 [Dimorphilus gyrociliatus]|uniref:ascorbate ferrireductase (transmembrane) n=1 Tax=Dimorphilus gyrociliatus TaxID=2664684 RepID=A0A7I8VB70_9ANNE|nr:DgyrCDS2747 [Dimorphilus gyrociliatus]